MINFKKSTGKIGKIKRDYGINLNTIINKNLEITIYVNEEKIIRTAINILDILKLNIDNISELNNIKIQTLQHRL